MKQSIILAIGCALAGLSVLAGAFASHGLKGKLDDYYMGIFKTAVDYHMYHALGIILFALLLYFKPEVSRWPAYVMLTGIILFSGSLYCLALSSMKGAAISKLGMITPFGGIAFLIAWIGFAVLALKHS